MNLSGRIAGDVSHSDGFQMAADKMIWVFNHQVSADSMLFNQEIFQILNLLGVKFLCLDMPQVKSKVVDADLIILCSGAQLPGHLDS